MIDFTPILQALIVVVGILTTGYLIPYIKNKLTPPQQSQLAEWVSLAVTAAEQVYSSGQGKQKKEYALEWLRKQGVALDNAIIEAQVELFLETAVYQLKNEY